MRQLIVIKVSFAGHTRSLSLSLHPPSVSLNFFLFSASLLTLPPSSRNALLTHPMSGSRACSPLPPNRVPPGTLSVRDPRRGLLSFFFFSLSSPSPSFALPPPPFLYYHHLRRCSRPLPPPPLSRFRSFWKTPRKGFRGTFWDQCRRGCPTSRYIRFIVVVATAVRADVSAVASRSRFLNFPPVENPPEIRAISYVLSESWRLSRL